MTTVAKKIGFLFDMDGVLVDSVGFNWRAYNEVLRKEYGFEVPEEEIHKYMGMALGKQVVLLSAAYGTIVDLGSFKDRTDAIKANNSHLLTAKHGAEACLNMLKENNIRLAVGTSNTREVTIARLEQIGLLSFFDAIITEADVTHHKPDAETYLAAARALGLDPTFCTVVEDAPAGLESGRSAGCRLIGVRTPYVTSEALSVADLVVNELDEITLEFALG